MMLFVYVNILFRLKKTPACAGVSEFIVLGPDRVRDDE